MNSGGSPTRSYNVYFANNEQASLVFFIAHAEHNLIKYKLYNNWLGSKVKLRHNKNNFLGLNSHISVTLHVRAALVKSANNHNNAGYNLIKFKLYFNWSAQAVNSIFRGAFSNSNKPIKFAHL